MTKDPQLDQSCLTLLIVYSTEQHYWQVICQSFHLIEPHRPKTSEDELITHQISLQNIRLHIKLRHTSCKILERCLHHIAGTGKWHLRVLCSKTCDPWKPLWRVSFQTTDVLRSPTALTYCTFVQEVKLPEQSTCFMMIAKCSFQTNVFHRTLAQEL